MYLVTAPRDSLYINHLFASNLSPFLQVFTFVNVLWHITNFSCWRSFEFFCTSSFIVQHFIDEDKYSHRFSIFRFSSFTASLSSVQKCFLTWYDGFNRSAELWLRGIGFYSWTHWRKPNIGRCAWRPACYWWSSTISWWEIHINVRGCLEMLQMSFAW